MCLLAFFELSWHWHFLRIEPILRNVLQLGFDVSSWLDLDYVIFAKEYYINDVVTFSVYQMYFFLR